MPDIIPKEAPAYLKNKKLQPSFSYKDVWREEHAAAFTVAKAVQLDVLSDLHSAVIEAVEKGQSFESFKKNLKPVLQQKGWWGKKEMTDPLTGETVNARLGSGRRLETVYRVNMRSAYQKGQYERTMASDLHPYLMYRIGPSIRHRKDHVNWDGLILPKDDPWRDSRFPPNGWGCKCYTRAVTEARKKQYEENGIPAAPKLDGSGGGSIPAETQAPPVKYKTYFNERKGTFEKVPEGAGPAFNWNQGKAGNKTALQKLEDSKKNLEKAAAAKPKKEYLTKKKLEGGIADLDAQIKNTKDRKAQAGLEAEKAEYQQLLDKKSAAADKKKLVKEQAALKKELDSITVKTYTGIWKDGVTTADWQEKAESIQAKKDYFQGRLNAGGLSDADKAKFEQFLKDLDEFAVEGKHYCEVRAALKKAQNSLTNLKKDGTINLGLDDAFSQARKDAALWAKSPKEADNALREVCGRVRQNASKAERRAVYDYTCGSGGFNRPLRGYDGSWNNFKGIGKVGLDAEAGAVEELTRLIDKSSYDIDIWLQRGVGTTQGAASFLKISESDLHKMTQSQLEKKLMHQAVTDAGFVSCGSAKGQGFNGYIFNIYCPKGTKMIYAEPFSDYGEGAKLDWNGITKQKSFGDEDETIIQRGTTFRVIKVEKKSGNVYFDLEVISQISGE
ncbi:MAG: hypothetical protein LBH35_07290 [Treponema sp.]|jgi:hypothetical protein|nr:hypothetical protein [Treponema sp.]